MKACEALKLYLALGRPVLAAKSPIASAIHFLNRRGQAFTPTGARHRFALYRMKLGLSRRLYPHALRAACATHMMRHNAHPRHLMELLGHADLTSLHRYTAVEIAELKAIHAKTHPRELKGAA